MTTLCPAILIAAPASGQGKTTVASALARLHTRRGLRVRVFKCGPDFLDPNWLSLACGAPVHQLDLWMTGAADCAQRLHDAALEADLIIVEGVMGLFDGQPSAADLAQRFGLFVVAVIDSSAMASTFGALAWGLQTYREGLRFAGVLANRVASPGHAVMLKSGLRDPALWLGGLARSAAFTLPARHLGLVLASELPDAMVRLDAAADALMQTALGQMTLADLQRWSVAFEPPEDPVPMPKDALQGVTVAVARDAAFCFMYAANIDCLHAMGAQVVYFSPLADAGLPPCNALWLPGGYPELHGPALAANVAMRDSITAHVRAGQPVWAECGGMIALFDDVVTADGSLWPMWGVLSGRVTLQKRLAALGPQQLRTAGGTLRGHAFHYSTCATDLPVQARTQASPRSVLRGEGEALYQQGPVQATYFHAWFASDPAAAAQLFLTPSHD
jgi:cobyrinic acid a,c-diamide synthase